MPKFALLVPACLQGNNSVVKLEARVYEIFYSMYWCYTFDLSALMAEGV